MKTSVWDILTAIVLLGIVCMVGAFALILLNPTAVYNPLRPQTLALVPTVELIIPTATATPTITTTPIFLPPTWTPTPDYLSPLPQGKRTLRPTSTIAPTGTVVLVPTLTRAWRGGSTDGGRCSVSSQSPRDGTYLLRNSEVEIHWVIKNTSGETWRSDSVDVHNINSDSHNLLSDLPYDVSNGSEVDIVLSMITPSSAGKYIANFALVQGSEEKCKFFFQFNIN